MWNENLTSWIFTYQISWEMWNESTCIHFSIVDMGSEKCEILREIWIKFLEKWAPVLLFLPDINCVAGGRDVWRSSADKTRGEEKQVGGRDFSQRYFTAAAENTGSNTAVMLCTDSETERPQFYLLNSIITRQKWVAAPPRMQTASQPTIRLWLIKPS